MSEIKKLSNEIMLFVRFDCFYLVYGVEGIPLKQQAEDHAILNPGTHKVLDINHNILWSA